MIRRLLIGMAVGLTFASWASAGEPASFTTDSLAKIKAQYAGRPLILSLWSVNDCSYCIAELTLFGQYAKTQKHLPLVLIATDSPEFAPAMQKTLGQFGLGSMDSWVFDDAIPERLRHAIDPSWYGELPRTYLYYAHHRRGAGVGVLGASTAWAVDAATGESALQEMTVTGTREGELLSVTPATVGIIKEQTLRETRPTHPKEILNQVPGVWVSNLSGEGHSTAIRQPLTTGAVYLYLEDGIPTRSTGFFNHNALYEINVPQSGGIEVMKGPGSALYGSDAIGGTINVLTRTPPREAEFELAGEAGSHGWGRILVGGGNAHGDDAWRASLNITHSDGWQESAGYDRQAGTARWDRALGEDALLKTVLSFSKVDQQHVGKLSRGELDAVPRTNNTPFSYRDVEAFRLSTAYEKETAHSLVSITPYVRDNSMEIIPNWSVGYDPSRYVTENRSFGFLSKYRRDFEPMRARLIVGLDFDYSPGSRDENSIKVNKTTNAYGGTRYSLDSTVAPVRIYDYDVSYRGISPYVHGEASLTDRLRLNAGLRYDDMQYDYDNKFNNGVAGATQGAAGFFPAGGWYGHVASTKVGYNHWGPKRGLTYRFKDAVNGFAAYSNSFRAPSEGQVFRGSRESTAVKAQAAAESLLNLEPVTVDNLELGLRGKSGAVRFEASVYHMTKQDDIVSYTDPVTTQRTVVKYV